MGREAVPYPGLSPFPVIGVKASQSEKDRQAASGVECVVSWPGMWELEVQVADFHDLEWPGMEQCGKKAHF